MSSVILGSQENFQNHVIDPTFFFDAIEEFSFNYIFFACTSKYLDESGRQKLRYEMQTIRGSLQTEGLQQIQSFEGNTSSMKYGFYCKSMYRINIGDFILYKNNFLRVDSVHEYDEFGCRSCSLTMVQLRDYRDLADYIKYLEGEKLI